jgi:hypothetical protein
MRIVMMSLMALIASAGLTASVIAQDDADLEDRLVIARQIVAATNPEDLFRTGLEATMPLVRLSFQGAAPGASPAQLDEATIVVISIIMETYPEISEASARIYADRFTLEELVVLDAFYQTPIGQKLSRELPGMTQQLAQLGDQIGQQAVTRQIDRVEAVFE